MSITPARVFSPLVLAFFLAFTLPVTAQIPGFGNKDKKEADKEKDKKKEETKAAKQARKYEELRAFAEDLYSKDPDFRDRVDEDYAAVQQAHMVEAFEKNTAPPARYTVVSDGDRLRLTNGLYDNKLVGDYINRIGQSVVPDNSPRLYGFRLVADPNPMAYTLSTGTIYISTGLLSLVQNEAQLSYILGHEMGHVHLDHWKLKSMLKFADEEYEKKQTAKRVLWTAIATGAGAAIGAAVTRDAGGAGLGAVAGLGAGLVVSSLVFRGLNLDWDRVQEDQADKLAFEMALRRNYNVRQVPNLYATLQEAVRRDARVGLGFMGNPKRVQQRIDKINDFINVGFKDEIAKANLVDSKPEFAMVMSELKRDNGILAFYYDMFYLAKTNLEQALEIRDNDPAVHYYYAKVLRLVGRSEDDMRSADSHFASATKLDVRNRFPAAHFYRALNLIDASRPLGDNPNKGRVVELLQQYLNASYGYASEEAALANYMPANLDDIYDYLRQAGEYNFRPSLPENLKANWHEGLPALLSVPPTPPVARATETPAVVPASNPVSREEVRPPATVKPGAPTIGVKKGIPALPASGIRK
jgi:hypothetical protein